MKIVFSTCLVLCFNTTGLHAKNDAVQIYVFVNRVVNFGPDTSRVEVSPLKIAKRCKNCGEFE